MSLLFIQTKKAKIGTHFVKERTLLAPPGVLNAIVHHYRSAGAHFFFILSTSPTLVFPCSFTITTMYMIDASLSTLWKHSGPTLDPSRLPD